MHPNISALNDMFTMIRSAPYELFLAKCFPSKCHPAGKYWEFAPDWHIWEQVFAIACVASQLLWPKYTNGPNMQMTQYANGQNIQMTKISSKSKQPSQSRLRKYRIIDIICSNMHHKEFSSCFLHKTIQRPDD